jgi:hypothetical protein
VSHEDLFRSLKEFCGRDLLFLEKPVADKTRRAPSKELYKLKDWLIVGAQDRKRSYLNQDAFLSAYASFFLPLYLPEVFSILQMHYEARKVLPRTATHLLDVGAGLGTATLSYLLWCQHNKIPLPKEVTLLDQSRKALSKARDFIKVVAPKVKVRLERIDLRNTVDLSRFLRAKQNYFDLTLMSHLLNEFGNGPRMRSKKIELIEKFLSTSSHEDGDLIIIEPAHREPSMDLMAIRDRLASEGMAIIGPCPAATIQCPALRAKAGSCYASPPRKMAEAWGLAPWDKQMMRFLGIDMDTSSFAYLWIKASDEALASAPKHSVLLTDPRSKRNLLCNGETLVKGRGPYRGALLT